MSKPKLRAQQATLSFTEKIKILEKLRDRDRAIAAAGLRAKVGRLVSDQKVKPTNQ